MRNLHGSLVGGAARGSIRVASPAFAAMAVVFLIAFRVRAAGQTPPPASEPPARTAPTPAAVADGDLPGIGDLLVAPTRVVFEGRTRAAELTLLNIGKRTATYRISFTHLRMTETGELKEIEKAGDGDRFADDLVRYSPRQVTLDPNVSQTIRLQVRRPENLADGEYRSHMLFRAVPPETAQPGTAVESQEKASGYSVRLIPIYGVSIPVIVRSGATSAKATLSDLAVRPPEAPSQPSTLEFKLRRDGNQSLYGNLRVVYRPLSGKDEVVAVMNGVAVYTPNPERLVRVALQPPPGVTLAKGRLKVAYSRAEQNGDVLASAETALP